MTRLDQFAELLSLDMPIPAIARQMGIKRASGYALLKTLRDKFGEQGK